MQWVSGRVDALQVGWEACYDEQLWNHSGCRVEPCCLHACRRYIAAFVEAADDVGGGACVSLVVTSESGTVLAAYRVHSNGPAGGALVEEPEQQDSGSSGIGNSGESNSGSSSGSSGQDGAKEGLDWIYSFHAASRPAEQ